MTALASSPDSADKNFRLFDAADALDSYGRGIYNESFLYTYGVFSSDTVHYNKAVQQWFAKKQWDLIFTQGLYGGVISSVVVPPLVNMPVPSEFVKSGLSNFNGDNRRDFLVTNGANSYALFTLNGSNGSSYPINATMPSDWLPLAQADFNGDQKTDILWNQKGTTNYKLWTMNGATVVSEQVMQSPVVGWSIVSTADFNGDGKADLLWKKDGTDYYVTWLMNGPAIISGAIHNAQPGWTVKSLADFNGDGKADILWYHSSINRYYMWLMNGNSVVDGSGYISEDPLSGWYIRAVDDFNGDGKADIFWGNSTTNSYFIWYFNGSKVINGMGIQKPAPGWEVYSSADFDGDKKSDLLWYNAASQKYYLWLLKGSAAGQAGSNYLSSQPFPSWQILK
jgi:hypothetical protein